MGQSHSIHFLNGVYSAVKLMVSGNVGIKHLMLNWQSWLDLSESTEHKGRQSYIILQPRFTTVSLHTLLPSSVCHLGTYNAPPNVWSADEVPLGLMRCDLITSSCTCSLFTERCGSHCCCPLPPLASPLGLVLLSVQIFSHFLIYPSVFTLILFMTVDIKHTEPHCFCFPISLFFHFALPWLLSLSFCVRLLREMTFPRSQPERLTYWWISQTSFAAVCASVLNICVRMC